MTYNMACHLMRHEKNKEQQQQMKYLDTSCWISDAAGEQASSSTSARLAISSFCCRLIKLAKLCISSSLIKQNNNNLCRCVINLSHMVHHTAVMWCVRWRMIVYNIFFYFWRVPRIPHLNLIIKIQSLKAVYLKTICRFYKVWTQLDYLRLLSTGHSNLTISVVSKILT